MRTSGPCSRATRRILPPYGQNCRYKGHDRHVEGQKSFIRNETPPLDIEVKDICHLTGHKGVSDAPYEESPGKTRERRTGERGQREARDEGEMETVHDPPDGEERGIEHRPVDRWRTRWRRNAPNVAGASVVTVWREMA